MSLIDTYVYFSLFFFLFYFEMFVHLYSFFFFFFFLNSTLLFFFLKQPNFTAENLPKTEKFQFIATVQRRETTTCDILKRSCLKPAPFFFLISNMYRLFKTICEGCIYILLGGGGGGGGGFLSYLFINCFFLLIMSKTMFAQFYNKYILCLI